MNLDIRTAVQTAFILALAGVVISLLIGVRNIRAGQRLLFFRKRRDLMVRGWRFIGFASVLGLTALLVNRFAEPTVYRFFPPSPTVTLTPTITVTPTITLTPTVSLTPTITDTPSITPTPQVPQAIQQLFEPTVVVNPNALFSPLLFSRAINEEGTESGIAVNPLTEFVNPVGTVYATFSFDQMSTGTQWTALWYRVSDQFMLCFETEGWTGSTGGYGFSECSPASAEMWQPGEYEVQLFVGYTWVQSGRFTVSGEPPTSTPTPKPSATASPTRTKVPTSTITPTRTITLTPTQTATRTITPTWTPTKTPLPTSTRRPTLTPRPTNTRAPTPTLTPSPTRRR
jgi:type VI secretion system secreted protein VgrG